MLDFRQIESGLASGDAHTAEKLLPLIYNELRSLAAQKLAGEISSPSFQPTDLVHEAFLRIEGKDEQRQWDDLFHFFAAAADEMRRVLIDRARRKNRLKHGAGRRPIGLDRIADPVAPAAGWPLDDAVLVEDALSELANEDPSAAELVRLRFFAGLTLEQAAAAMEISRATASRRWTYARAWLYEKLRGSEAAWSPSAGTALL
jgi:RNA polymerase sigma factor (TIGR02999 family)